MRIPMIIIAVSVVVSATPARARADYAVQTSTGGDRLLLCGSPDRSLLQERLEDDPTDFYLTDVDHDDLLFVVGFPAAFPSSYWGIEKATEAYVCIGANRYTDSWWELDWALGTFTRTGAFSEFGVSIYGYKVDKEGFGVDVDGDDDFDDLFDWVALNYLTVFAGATEADADAISLVVSSVWNHRSTSGEVTFSAYDGEGYPGRIEVSTYGGGAYFEAEIGAQNQYVCTEQAGQCITWPELSGALYSVAPIAEAPHDSAMVLAQDMVHVGNRWVRWDPMTDSYAVHDLGLYELLDKTEWKPEFWVLSRDTKLDFVAP